MAHFEFVGKDHLKRGCHCPLEECSLDCSLRRKLVNKPTNADRIRSMSDEELANEFLDAQCESCDWQGNCPDMQPCIDRITEWLKAEVQDV